MKKVKLCGVAVAFALGALCIGCKSTEGAAATDAAAGYDAETAKYTLNIDASGATREISPLLFGAFLEDINFAADGGLYAEMVQNRSFEFKSYAAGNEMHAWSNVGKVSTEVSTKEGLNENNPTYVVIKNTSGKPAGIANKGFLDGMSIVKDGVYDFSVYAKGMGGYSGKLTAEIRVGGKTVASASTDALSDSWKKYELELTSSAAASSNVTLAVLIEDGSVAVDMVSLFPRDTFKGRKNGLRKDLAEKLEALQPAFFRFPGGCLVEGYSMDTAYDWKQSIGADKDGNPLEFNGQLGDVAARKQGLNIWTNLNTRDDPYPSFMTYGMGFYELFLFSEDIGALAVPVLNCGMACMARRGNMVKVDSPQMEKYIQDVLDLVEFCRGGEDTTWGAVRIAMGHEEPFALKYIGVGNEQWAADFYEHYEWIMERFLEAKDAEPEKYEGIELIYSAGVDDGDSGYLNYISAYREAERWLGENPERTIEDFAGAIDHHYYNEPDWFLTHTDYYDDANYSREKTPGFSSSLYGGGFPVFLGEYAGQSNTFKAALSEAAYMTGLERNGDIVVMAAYAPLFGNLTALHWAPDLIWFNNHVVTCSVNYYVQQIFSLNAGTGLLSSKLSKVAQDTSKKKKEEEGLSGAVGVGTWNTSAKFDNVKVVDSATGAVLAEDDFASGKMTGWKRVADGSWSVKDGELENKSVSTDMGLYGNTGSSVYFGDNSWKNYTYTVTATKTGGEEGFLIPFAVRGVSDNFFWNLGGWGNTVSCLQRVSGGVKSDQLSGTAREFKAETGKAYELKVVVTDTNVKCYVDGELYVDYSPRPAAQSEDMYHVVSTDETGDIIVKLVNVSGNKQPVALNIENANVQSEAELYLVAGSSLADDNILGGKEVVSLQKDTLSDVSQQFNYVLPKYSVTVLRIKTEGGKTETGATMSAMETEAETAVDAIEETEELAEEVDESDEGEETIEESEEEEFEEEESEEEVEEEITE